MILKYLLAICSVVLFFGNSLVFAADSYVVGASATVTIDEHSVCKEVTNSLGAGIMVPTKSANEWHTGGASFLENLYAGISVANCPPPCGGTLVGGYCWYLGSAGSNCTSACSAHGGVDMVGTRDYAGSGGTNANCFLVLDALIVTGETIASAVSDDNKGCFYNTDNDEHRRGMGITTSSASHTDARRACACSS